MYYIKYVIVLLISIFIFNIYISAYTEYSVGDTVTYNGIGFYVIKDSGANEESLTLLKAEPLTVEEVNQYGGVGTENNHVNINVCSLTEASCYQTAKDENGYGGVAYYSSDTCENNIYTGCITNYEQSDIKYIVDTWGLDNITTGLQEVRLLTIEDLIDNLGYENNITCTGGCYYSGLLDNVPVWLYNSNYWYWTMAQNGDQALNVWGIGVNGSLESRRVTPVHPYFGVVRPVIILKKTSLGDIEENTGDNEKESKKSDVNTIVNVPNTMRKISIVLIVIGVILVSISIVIVIKIKK